LDFFESAYQAGASGAGWDIAALASPVGDRSPVAEDPLWVPSVVNGRDTPAGATDKLNLLGKLASSGELRILGGLYDRSGRGGIRGVPPGDARQADRAR
jgi:hypothetical protein